MGGGLWLRFEQGLPGAEQCWLKTHLLTAPLPHTSQGRPNEPWKGRRLGRRVGRWREAGLWQGLGSEGSWPLAKVHI